MDITGNKSHLATFIEGCDCAEWAKSWKKQMVRVQYKKLHKDDLLLIYAPAKAARNLAPLQAILCGF